MNTTVDHFNKWLKENYGSSCMGMALFNSNVHYLKAKREYLKQYRKNLFEHIDIVEAQIGEIDRFMKGVRAD